MDVNDLAGPAGDSFKFETIGDTIKGTVAYIGGWETKPSKFRQGEFETAMRLVVDTVDGPKAIYPRKDSAMARAIADAIRASGATRLEVGAKLAVKFDRTLDTGKGQPAKLFVAQYEAPAATASVAASDLF